MAKKNETLADSAKQEFTITRILDAPRELVFKAWTSVQQLQQWYAPSSCTLHFINADFRVGGFIHTCIRVPQGKDCWCKGVYKEFVVPERIVHTMHYSDKDGNFVEPEAYKADPDWPREMLVTITFEDLDGKTKLTLHQTVAESLAKRTGAHPSWIDMFERLDAVLATV